MAHLRNRTARKMDYKEAKRVYRKMDYKEANRAGGPDLNKV